MQVALFLIAACVAPIGAAHLLTESRLDSSGKVRQLKPYNQIPSTLFHSSTAHTPTLPPPKKKRKEQCALDLAV